MANNSESEMDENVKWFLGGFIESFIVQLQDALLKQLRSGKSVAVLKRGLKGLVSETFDDVPDSDELKDYKKKIVRKTVAFLDKNIDTLSRQVNKGTVRRSNTAKRNFLKGSFLRNVVGKTRKRQSIRTSPRALIAPENTEMNIQIDLAPPAAKKSGFNMSALADALKNI